MTAPRPDLDLSKLQPGDEPGVWVEPAGRWVLCSMEQWHTLLAAAEAGHTAEAPLHIRAQATGRASLRSADPATHEVLLASMQAEATEEISRTAETLMPRMDSDEEERFTVPHTLPQRTTNSPAPPPKRNGWNTPVLVVSLLALLLTLFLQLRPLQPLGGTPAGEIEPEAQKTTSVPSTAPSQPVQAPIQVAEADTTPGSGEAADAPAERGEDAPAPAPSEPAAPRDVASPTASPRAHTLSQLRDEGWSASDSGNFGEAINWFRKAVAKAPQDVEANYGYGYALLKAGRPDDALVHLCAAFAADDGTLEGEIRGILGAARLSCDGM